MKFEELYRDNSDSGNKHYSEPLERILGSRYTDHQEASKRYIKQKEQDSEYYGYPYELTPFEADVGTVIYKRKMKLQPKSQPQTQPVKQMKKPKKGKGIIKVIAGVGTVVLGILGIIYAIENSKPILPGSPYDGSNHYSQQQDDEYSYDDEPDYKEFTR